ncbi:MAG TPA: 30S ribosomal protein S18 [bacterium]|nr:30S ribosomal protein S18 [bacterium]
MAFFRSRRDDKGKKKKKMRPPNRRRQCRFCADKKISIDYKDGRFLAAFTTERGKIVPRRISGNCAKHQREITEAIKRARVLALIPYSAVQVPLV